MTESQQSDALKKLVIFMVYLAVVATIAVLFIYFTTVLPAQQAMLHAPSNIIIP